MTTGDRIRKRRKEIGITADDLAAEIGVDRSTVYRYENGDIEKVPITVLEPVATALHTTVAYLMGWTPEATDYEDGELIASIPQNLIYAFDGDVKKAYRAWIARTTPNESGALQTRSDDTKASVGAFAQRLKQLRKKIVISQAELAKQFNISTGTIGMWETGQRMPDSDMLVKIAQYFGVSVDYLLGNDEMKKPAGVPDELWEELCKDEDKMRLAIWICQLSGEDLDRVEKLLDAALLSPPE